MYSTILDFFNRYFMAIYVFLTILSLVLAIHFLRKKSRPNKPTYAIYMMTICIFFQQVYLVFDSLFAVDDDYRWAIAFLYFGAFYIINIITVALFIKNAKVLKYK